MNGITVRQNTDIALRLLAAQRELYASAKRVVLAQFVAAGPIAVVLAIAANAFPSSRVYASLYGLTLALLDILVLTPWQERLRHSAAGVQECFDCDVLELSWNELKAGKKPTLELVHEAVKRYAKRARKMPPLQNWYARGVEELPLPVGRIACQRANCWWDAQLRRRYRVALGGAIAFLFAVVLVVSLVRSLTLENFFLSVLGPLLPLLVLGTRQILQQKEAADRLDHLREHAESLWEDALRGASDADLREHSRNFQDEILDSRRRSPLVPDLLYNRLQREDEEQMNKTVSDLVAEANKRMGAE